MNVREYRGIGSVAEATGEQLGVFHGVRGQVHLQTGSVCVTTITVLALEWFVFVVLATVRLLKDKKILKIASQRKVQDELKKPQEGHLPAGWTTG